mmetsp:Transcript_1731/g.3908  ORF Transcript_1731/g.3908 Transcript_1731/m.3908 type:complete len:398 (+) Transcript_1731:261-1454(+)|eukprot:CAMPEP_0197590144 /NCGR_PEP_ID=MMETSP1326-20131121/10836_1 /TAXON_ID=1155430 /ORGANISM="Genus nov. species nov., Strain RCC2288" /LENGTH=397 /DNA_ID=CAMNT_0043155151 /DNA_START=184 /DNA_END=1377 /DNA_ORIENTATION=-
MVAMDVVRSNTAGTGPGLRQAGGEGGTVGALKRGSTRDYLSGAPKSHSSIPSKYETLINVNAKAPDGFGGRTYRLDSRDADTPGPGTYVGSVALMVKRTDSLSKKGYGNGFVSKERRLPRDPNEYFRGPGPGQYEGARLIVSDFNRAKTTGSFARPLDNVGPPLEPKMDKRAGPGPGQYTPALRGGAAINSAFRSGTDRFGIGGRSASAAASLPSPGTYNVHVVDSAFRPDKAAPSAAFNSKSQRSQLGASTGRKVGGGAPSIIYASDEAEGLLAAGGASPGPGQYGYGFDREETAYRLLLQRAGKSSAAFARTHEDRFGRSTLNRVKEFKVPGPGTYGAKSGLNKHRAVTGVFKSTSDRSDPVAHAEALPPGPAFYKSEGPVGKKSFHLNSLKRFV